MGSIPLVEEQFVRRATEKSLACRLRKAGGLKEAVMARKQVGNYARGSCKITNPVQGARAL